MFVFVPLFWIPILSLLIHVNATNTFPVTVSGKDMPALLDFLLKLTQNFNSHGANVFMPKIAADNLSRSIMTASSNYKKNNEKLFLREKSPKVYCQFYADLIEEAEKHMKIKELSRNLEKLNDFIDNQLGGKVDSAPKVELVTFLEIKNAKIVLEFRFQNFDARMNPFNTNQHYTFISFI